MSLLIKGMEMPKTCNDCPFYDRETWCLVPGDWRLRYNKAPRGKRQDNCPLVEVPPHGRLIDADALYETCVLDTSTDIMASTKRINEYMQLKIDDAPTVIEAEDGE